MLKEFEWKQKCEGWVELFCNDIHIGSVRSDNKAGEKDYLCFSFAISNRFPFTPDGLLDGMKWTVDNCKTELESLFVLPSQEENERLREIMHTAQGLLTALNVGDIQSGSPLHLHLRKTMIKYREDFGNE